jgi:hypothetical protein
MSDLNFKFKYLFSASIFVLGIPVMGANLAPLDGEWEGSQFDLTWESVSGPYLIQQTDDLRSSWQLHSYKFGAAGTNRTTASLPPGAEPRPRFFRVIAGGDLLAVENFTRADNADVEAGHNINTYTSNPYTEYDDETGWEVHVAGNDMWFDLTSASADDVTVVTQGGRLDRLASGDRFDLTATLRPPSATQPDGAFWGMGVSFGTDEQWPASLIAVELEDSGAARFYRNGTLAAAGTVPDGDERKISIVLNTMTRRAAVVVNGVEYFFMTNAVYDTTAPIQLVMHAAKPAGDAALFRVDRWLSSSVDPDEQNIVAETSVFNPLYFGADPTGVLDSSPAFNAMTDTLGDDRHSALYIPPGTYRLGSPWVIPAVGNADQYGMQIRGGGEDVTCFLIDNPVGGIRFAGDTISMMQLTLRDFSIRAQQPGIGYGFWMDLPPTGVTQNRNLNILNVETAPDFPTLGNFFVTNFNIHCSWYPKFENIRATDGSYGLYMNDCYNPLIDSAVFSGTSTGLAHTRTVQFPEDGKIRSSFFRDCETGVLIDITDREESSWAEPAFHINNCNFRCSETGILVDGMRQLFFSHNAFESPSPTAAPTDIRLHFANSAVLDHNFFFGESSTNRISIDIGEYAGYVSILGNQFDTDGTAIRNESVYPVAAKHNLYAE